MGKFPYNNMKNSINILEFSNKLTWEFSHMKVY